MEVPEEVLINILQYLPFPASLPVLQLVCKTWQHLSIEPEVWMNVDFSWWWKSPARLRFPGPMVVPADTQNKFLASLGVYCP